MVTRKNDKKDGTLEFGPTEHGRLYWGFVAESVGEAMGSYNAPGAYSKDPSVRWCAWLSGSTWCISPGPLPADLKGKGNKEGLTHDEALKYIDTEAKKQHETVRRTQNEAIGRLQRVTEAVGKLDRSMRDRLAMGFKGVGLDGNGNFESSGKGIAAATHVLSKEGIELADTPSFYGPEGRHTFRLAWSNEADAFSPEEIRNSTLVFSWHKRQSGNYECLAYVS